MNGWIPGISHCTGCPVVYTIAIHGIRRHGDRLCLERSLRRPRRTSR